MGTTSTKSVANIMRPSIAAKSVVTMSSIPNGSMTNADEQYIHLSSVVIRYLPMTRLNHTIYAADTHADVAMMILPKALDCSWPSLLLDTITDIVPASPRSSPHSRCLVNLSMPAMTESSNTIRGVVVLIIEPSMAEV